jgi:hypothetical protein
MLMRRRIWWAVERLAASVPSSADDSKLHDPI